MRRRGQSISRLGPAAGARESEGEESAAPAAASAAAAATAAPSHPPTLLQPRPQRLNPALTFTRTPEINDSGQLQLRIFQLSEAQRDKHRKPRPFDFNPEVDWDDLKRTPPSERSPRSSQNLRLLEALGEDSVDGWRALARKEKSEVLPGRKESDRKKVSRSTERARHEIVASSVV
ncbi:MAG: hypothetical protein P4M11_01265 [Candidatus Pacebacteria bacterium]|nr:hypothetical protein [Candidatus Paceibacterota bacterium]